MPVTADRDSDFKTISQQNYNQINRQISKLGYSDGKIDGRQSVFQKNFDQGYAEGFSIGFEFAKYKSLLAVSAEKLNYHLKEELELFNKLKAKANINKVNQPTTSSEISQIHLENKAFKINLCADLPQATNIFNKQK